MMRQILLISGLSLLLTGCLVTSVVGGAVSAVTTVAGAAVKTTTTVVDAVTPDFGDD